jgi:hypothetical protein
MPNMLNKLISSVVLSSEQQVDFHKNVPHDYTNSYLEEFRR